MHISESFKKAEQMKIALAEDEYEYSPERVSVRMLKFITGMLIAICFGVAFCAGYVTTQEEAKNLLIIQMETKK